MLENLNYERNYLRGEIGAIQGWRASELELMACSELGEGLDVDVLNKKKEGRSGVGVADADDGSGNNDDDDVNMKDNNDSQSQSSQPSTITTTEQAIDTYLLFGTHDPCELPNFTTINSIPIIPVVNNSHRDPIHHIRILSKLQTEIKTRSSLVEKLSQSKLQLKEMQKKRDTLRGFLNAIPNKMKELERVGESLNQMFFEGDDNNNGGGDDVWKEVLNEKETEEDEMENGGDNGKKKVQAANLLVNRPSLNRTKRFQLAQSKLSSPLYSLYIQLAGYMDAWSTVEKLGEGGGATTTSFATDAMEGGKKKRKVSALDGFVGASGMSVSVEEIGEGGWSVVLTVSASDILPPETSSILGKGTFSSRSSPSSSAIKIVFSFDEEQGVIFALSKDESSKSIDTDLLDNLFLGDDGLVNPNVSLSLLKQDEDEISEDDSDEGGDQGMKDVPNGANLKNGKPYYWCQVLGGLNFPPPSSTTDALTTERNDDNSRPFQVEACTKAVFRQLLRRIRAQETLAAIVEYLGKRSQLLSLPVHPGMKGEDGTVNQPSLVKAKLHSWVEDTRENTQSLASTKKSYVATIKRKSSAIKATVVIDTQNYPSEPPVWTLQNEDGSSGTLSSWGEEHGSVSSLQGTSVGKDAPPPLFDAALHRIECHVNQDLDKFVHQDLETTYDWILIHQLADIVSCWDEVMSAADGAGGRSGKDDGMGSMMTGHSRMRKGKDRKLIGFGERSSFYWYRNGL